jgi:hypothetical protein
MPHISWYHLHYKHPHKHPHSYSPTIKLLQDESNPESHQVTGEMVPTVWRLVPKAEGFSYP